MSKTKNTMLVTLRSRKRLRFCSTTETIGADTYARTDLEGLVVLGGSIPPKLDTHLRKYGAIIFPRHPSAPVAVYRDRLYHPAELYNGITHGYEETPDARAYRWAQDSELL